MTRHAPGPAADPASAEGELAHLTARILANAGLPVGGPDAANPRRILIFTPDARYILHISDDARAELRTDHDDPHHAADAAAALLTTAPSSARHPDAVSGTGITFKGIAAMDLKAKGLRVALNVYTDEFYYDVVGDIAATNPRADTGTVYINDQGGLTWYRDPQPQNDAGANREPRPRPRPPDPHAAARDIAATITRAATASQARATSAPEDPAARFIP